MEIEIDYPPNFRSRYGYGQSPAKYINDIIEAKRQEQCDFLATAQSFQTFLSAIPLDAAEADPAPRWNQPWFPPLDGISLYTLIAVNKPKYFVEIGSGNSTKFARRAIQDLGLSTKIISIDPYPRSEIDALSDSIYRTQLEDTNLSLFLDLNANDIVFFDGSHRSFQNSDVTVFFVDVLPALRADVIVGIHDIFWPNDYPTSWVNRYYNEQYLLAAYMLALGTKFPLIFSSQYSSLNLFSAARACLTEDALDQINSAKLGVGGGCLWFRKPFTSFTK